MDPRRLDPRHLDPRHLDPRRLVMGATIATCFVLTPLVPSALAAQEAQEPQAQFEAELDVAEVQLDVLVTDTRGNVVIGLGPDDFVVEEEGEPVEITSVAFYSNRRFVQSEEMAARVGVDTELLPRDRYFVLLIQDDRVVAPGELTRQYMNISRYTRQWVLERLLPNDWIAVTSYDTSLKLWLDFSNDKREIEAALARMFSGGKPMETWPSRQAEAKEGPSLLRDLPQGKDLVKSSTKIYDAMRLLSGTMEGVAGRKNILFFSLGFGEARSGGVWTPDPRYYPEMVQALNDKNIAVYPIDVVSTTDAGTIQDRGNNQALSQLASDTGGRYYFSFNTFLEPLEAVAEENNGYYLLSYRSSYPAGTEGYRKVKVETVNPTFEVRARQGYVYGD